MKYLQYMYFVCQLHHLERWGKFFARSPCTLLLVLLKNHLNMVKKHTKPNTYCNEGFFILLFMINTCLLLVNWAKLVKVFWFY